MFTVEELDMISAALIKQGESVQRMAVKPGLPASVKAEYQKVYGAVVDLNVKVIHARDALKVKK